jgi:hypothetical protein
VLTIAAVALCGIAARLLSRPVSIYDLMGLAAYQTVEARAVQNCPAPTLPVAGSFRPYRIRHMPGGSLVSTGSPVPQRGHHHLPFSASTGSAWMG